MTLHRTPQAMMPESYDLCLYWLRDGRITLKHFLGDRSSKLNWRNNDRTNFKRIGPRHTESYKSIPGMPVFETFEEARAFRTRLTGSAKEHFINKSTLHEQLRILVGE